MFWCILTAALVLAALIGFLAYWVIPKAHKYDREWGLFIFVPCLFVALIVGSSSLALKAEYNQFELSYEIQREFIEDMAAADPNVNTSLVYVADILDANKELAEYQAANDYYGFFSLIPDRVHNIQKIGIP